MDKETKNTKERERWRLKRAELLIAQGIDPASRPIRGDGKRGRDLTRGKRALPAEMRKELEQQPGESEPDYKRRYAREVMRRWRVANKEKEAARRRELYAANREEAVAKKKEYRTLNPEKAKAWNKKYFDSHKEDRLAILAAWQKENPERLAEIKQTWREDNRARCNAYSSKWRKAARIATPSWVDFGLIEFYYEEAVRMTEATGIAHHGDHIVPLQGRNVCGLHVHNNLRVITATENMKKRNKLIDHL